MKIISTEDYNQFIMDCIHVEATYRTALDAIEDLSITCKDPSISAKLKTLLQWIEKENGGPDELERVRESIR